MPIEKFGGTVKFEETKKLDELKNIKCQENKCHLFRLKYNYSNEDFMNVVNQIKTLIKMAKRAYSSELDKDYKALGKKAFKYLHIQDTNTPEYVDTPKSKED